MRHATVYQREDGFYVHSNSSTTSGVWIATRPFVKISVDAPIEELGKAVEEALVASRVGIAHPQDWDAVEYPLPELAGVKSWATFMKKARCANIKDMSGYAEVVPSKNLGPERGYEPIEDEVIVVPAIASERLGTALLEAFERCR